MRKIQKLLFLSIVFALVMLYLINNNNHVIIEKNIDVKKTYAADTKVHEHSYNAGEITTEATCEKTGIRTYTCTVCGATKTETVSSLGHDYENIIVESQNNEDGYVINICRNCEKEIRGKIIHANELLQGKNNSIHNTEYFQKLLDEAPEGSIIILPKGTYYFAYRRRVEQNKQITRYCINCKSNIIIQGAGIEEKNNTTIKPYNISTEEEIILPFDIKINDVTYKKGTTLPSDEVIGDANISSVNTFIFDYYGTSKYTNEKYIENAHFKDFILNAEEAKRGNKYNSDGKGFRIMLAKNCSFENLVVKHTWATGLAMDCPINCIVTNCIAESCGEGVKSIKSEGGSGFGMGTGNSNEESMVISNCEAINCGKYGFFFENQNRFSSSTNPHFKYSQGEFIISNCKASGNMYDFGGERAHDITFENCLSEKSNNGKTKAPFHLGDCSVRCYFVNCKSEIEFTDTSTDTSKEEYKAMSWAIKNGVVEINEDQTFNPTSELTRGKTMTFLHRIAQREGTLVVGRTSQAAQQPSNYIFDDVSLWDEAGKTETEWGYAIKWAKEKGIAKGTSSNKFQPENGCTRAQAITFLYRYAGSPQIDENIPEPYTDIDSLSNETKNAIIWAYERGITQGTSKTEFSPNQIVTKIQMIIFIYRYTNNKNITFNITYNTLGGEFKNIQPNTYISGNSLTIKEKPTKKGYDFIGWTGNTINSEGSIEENNYIPTSSITIKSTDIGHKTYSANWEGHDYKKKIVDSTCTQKGYTLYKCSRCGIEYKDNETESLGHNYDSGVITKEATCEEAGTKTYTCTRCGTTKREEIKALGHDVVIDKAIAATCTSEGKTTGKHCLRCNKIIEEQETIPALGHNYDSGVITKEATCEETGTKTYTCTRCGTTKREEIKALGHDVVIDKAIAATCTSEGKTTGKHCLRCNKIIEEQETIPALGHNYDSGVITKEATCEEAGTKTYTCTRCGTTKREEIKALGHDVVIDKAIAATCTSEGKTTGKHCLRCNKIIEEQETIPALGHNYDSGVITKEATCEEAGTKTYTCTRCGTTKREEIKALGHDVVIDKAIAATCTSEGKTTGKHCLRCNKIIEEQETIPALGHNYDSGVITKEATCEETGTKTYTCTRCGTTKTEEIKALGHNYINGKCTICGKEESKIKVKSDYYSVENNISKIQPNTSLNDFIKKIETNATEIEVYKDEQKVEETEKIATGMKIKFILGNQTKTYEVVVTGDTNGDGEANFKDIIKMNKHRLGKSTLNGAFEKAGDVTGNGKIDFKDIVKINKFRLNKIFGL